MTETDATHRAHEDLPPLSRDHAFWGMTATQLLGAFNDNLFKQLVLLLCVDYAARSAASGDVYQTVAQGLFAVPFVLFSGFGGYLSDRTRKRRIVILCKVAEIGVMLAGIAAFLAGGLSPLFVVLFCMGTQSAFFGPAKYGILPEMLRERDLPAGNGVIQMTTFLAIIFGTAAAGYLKEWLPDRLWLITVYCVGIAVAGTVTSLAVRRTPVARPGLSFEPSVLWINEQTRRLLRRDRTLLGVLLVSSLFWFVGGVVLPAVNQFGKRQMELGDGRTSLLATCMGVGIAVGCVLAGKLSKHQVRFGLVRIGGWGIVLCFAAVAAIGLDYSYHPHKPLPDRPPETLAEMLVPASQGELLARIVLTGLGAFAGMFVVPLQVVLQSRPPEDQKGRMIGTMNLVNWIGILVSAGFYYLCTVVLELAGAAISWTFAATGLLMLPVALFYRPRDEVLA